MVSPVDPSQTIARLVALMRQAAGRGERAGTAARNASAQDGAKGAEAAAATLGLRVRAIGPDHPRRRHAMARVLVETLLTDEFGDAAVNDAGFQAIVDDVLDAMERSAGPASDLDRVVDALLNPTG